MFCMNLDLTFVGGLVRWDKRLLRASTHNYKTKVIDQNSNQIVLIQILEPSTLVLIPLVLFDETFVA